MEMTSIVEENDFILVVFIPQEITLRLLRTLILGNLVRQHD